MMGETNIISAIHSNKQTRREGDVFIQFGTVINQNRYHRMTKCKQKHLMAIFFIQQRQKNIRLLDKLKKNTEI